EPLVTRSALETRRERDAGRERDTLPERILQARGRLARLRVVDGQRDEGLAGSNPRQPGSDGHGRHGDSVLWPRVPRDVHELADAFSTQERLADEIEDIELPEGDGDQLTRLAKREEVRVVQHDHGGHGATSRGVDQARVDGQEGAGPSGGPIAVTRGD